MKKDYSEFVGREFGRWKVLSIVPERNKKGYVLAHCQCKCGTIRDVLLNSLRCNESLSCHCAHSAMPWLRKRPYESLYNRFVSRNQDRCAVEISYEDFIEFTKTEKCHYCGDPVSWTKHNLAKNSKSYNLDRRNNLLGYVSSNIVVCCTPCNIGKGRYFTYDEWVCMTAALKLFRERKRNAAAI